MVGQELPTMTEVARKLKEIIDGLIATGDWEHSVFLKASAGKLRELGAMAERLALLGEPSQSEGSINKVFDRRTVPPGHTQVFILLYQVDGVSLDGWCRNIKTLAEYSATRPAYRDENSVKEYIRSKPSGIERNGYVVANIKNEDFYNTEQSSVDAMGHQLLALKENAVKLENIVEFVHANKKHYAIHDDKLVFLNEE